MSMSSEQVECGSLERDSDVARLLLSFDASKQEERSSLSGESEEDQGTRAVLEAWRCITESLGVSEEASHRMWDRLKTAYTEPHRAYHTWDHVCSMCVDIRRGEERSLVRKPALVYAAVFFHDAVYDPMAKKEKNEDDSILLWQEYARECSQLPVDEESLVCDMINFSKDHLSIDISWDNSDILIFLDADLGILQSSQDLYHDYGRNIQQEFSHIPRRIFREKRSEFLEKMIEQARLLGKHASSQSMLPSKADSSSSLGALEDPPLFFRTTLFGDSWTASARAANNLFEEIQRLRSVPSIMDPDRKRKSKESSSTPGSSSS